MFIKITDAATGLIPDKSYNLCDQAANDLISKGQAIAITAKPEIKRAEKEETQRVAAKKVAKLSGNLAIAAEKATKAAKEATAAIEAAEKAQAKAEEAMAKAQDAEPEPPTTEDHKETCVDPDCKGCGTDNEDTTYCGDFSEFTDDAVRKMADDADLPDNVTNPATIRKKLIEAGFDPRKTDDDDTDTDTE